LTCTTEPSLCEQLTLAQSLRLLPRTSLPSLLTLQVASPLTHAGCADSLCSQVGECKRHRGMTHTTLHSFCFPCMGAWQVARVWMMHGLTLTPSCIASHACRMCRLSVLSRPPKHRASCTRFFPLVLRVLRITCICAFALEWGSLASRLESFDSSSSSRGPIAPATTSRLTHRGWLLENTVPMYIQRLAACII